MTKEQDMTPEHPEMELVLVYGSGDRAVTETHRYRKTPDNAAPDWARTTLRSYGSSLFIHEPGGYLARWELWDCANGRELVDSGGAADLGWR